MNQSVVVVLSEDRAPMLTALARRLGLPVVSASELSACPSDFVLQYCEQQLAIGLLSEPKMRPVSVDFTSLPLQRRAADTLARQDLIRALGKNRKGLIVLDATAGLGRDACLMAMAGCTVRMMEASPVISELLEDGLARLARADPALGKRLTLQSGQFPQAMGSDCQPDVVYLDPMYSESSRRARAGKEMYILQRLLPKCSEDGLLDSALAVAGKRVIVKRGIHVPNLDDREPDFRFKGRSNRYDVYLSKREESSGE